MRHFESSLMSKLLNRYRKTITFLIDKPKEIVCREISNRTKVQTVDISFIQIVIKPTFFDPFAGRGFINLQLSEIDKRDGTIIKCEIVPTSVTKNGIYILLFLLSMWTIVGLLISQFLFFFDSGFWLDNADSSFTFDTEA